MDYSLQVFSNFLYENREDSEIAGALKEKMNEDTRTAIRFVKEKYLQEIANADVLKNKWDELVSKDTQKILDKRDKLEKMFASNDFDAEDAIDLALDIISIESALPITTKTKEFFTKELRDVDAEQDETRKKRIAKVLGFRVIKVIDEAKLQMKGRNQGDTVKAIVTKEGKTILEPTKGKNKDSAVRNEVVRVVDQAGRTAKQELDSIEDLVKSPERAKIYADMLYKEFRNEQFEGTNKEGQLVAKYKELISRKDAIEAAAKKTGIGGERPTEKEMSDWENLNIYATIMDLYEYSKGKSKMSLQEVKNAIKKLKQSNLDALELINRHLTA